MAVRLAHRFAWTGLEPDAASAAVARARLEHSGVEHQLHELPFDDAPLDPPYDVVVAFEVLEHLEDDAGALEAWRSALRPGGLLVLSVPAWQSQFGPWDAQVGHFRRYAPQELEDLLRRAGYADPETALYGFPLGHVMEAVRNVIARRRPAETDVAAATSQSGRLLQPDSAAAGTVTRLATAPFRAFERTREWERLGTGLVASARRPS